MEVYKINNNKISIIKIFIFKIEEGINLNYSLSCKFFSENFYLYFSLSLLYSSRPINELNSPKVISLS